MKNLLDQLIERGEVNIDNSKTHKDFLRNAYRFAEANSHDNETWTGAIIVKNNHVLSSGANRFPPGVKQKKGKRDPRNINVRITQKGMLYTTPLRMEKP